MDITKTKKHLSMLEKCSSRHLLQLRLRPSDHIQQKCNKLDLMSEQHFGESQGECVKIGQFNGRQSTLIK